MTEAGWTRKIVQLIVSMLFALFVFGMVCELAITVKRLLHC